MNRPTLQIHIVAKTSLSKGKKWCRKVSTVVVVWCVGGAVVRRDTDHGLYLLGGDIVEQRRAHVAQLLGLAQHAVHAHLRRTTDHTASLLSHFTYY